jgi:hypothetical protein
MHVDFAVGDGIDFRPMEARILNLESFSLRVAQSIGKLEADMSHVQKDIGTMKTDISQIRGRQDRDFRILFGSLITVALGLGGLMAKGFGWL